jgi:hypothetical protein
MAKIYQWTCKGETGKVIADNTKDAKREIAKKFGNAIKIPKGTIVTKIGLAKAVKQIATVTPKPIHLVSAIVVQNIDESYVLTKNQTFTNATVVVDGATMCVGDEAELIISKGSRISKVIRHI